MEQGASLKAGLAAQRRWFATGATLDLATRREALEALAAGVRCREDRIFEALRADLGKSPAESYLTEIGLVLAELRYFLRHLKSWARPRRVGTPLALWPAKSLIRPEPLGQVLILSPWNYPFQLALLPLIAAVAAGNCVTLAPSASAPATSGLLEETLRCAFRPEHVLVLQGGAAAAESLLREKFDFIFYTGGGRVARLVLEAAAPNLTPVCLELGGKSPVIVAADADLDLAARRIAWGKTLNAGQTCVAPDHIWADRSIQAELQKKIEAEFKRMYGDDPLNNPEYPRLISEKAFDRLLSVHDFQPGELQADRCALKIAPKVFAAGPDDRIMREEIFGPLLPVLGYEKIDEAAAYIRAGEKPLALYVFAKNEELIRRLLERLSFGGCCVNDVVLQAASARLPFGGVGGSGMGRYHGRAGFELFSNRKSVLRQSTRLDPPLRYPPYGKNRLRLLRFFLR